MKLFVPLLICIIYFSCSRQYTKLSASTTESAVFEIKSILKNQEKSWNKGDILAFMLGYWKSDSLKFVGSNGISYGWNQTLKNYKITYPDKEAMGKLHFHIDLIEKLNEKTYYLIGRYTLTRKNDSPSGYFNLIWKKINGKWRIITDMTCG